MFAETFYEHFDLDDSGSLLLTFSKSTLTLHKISISLKIIQWVTTAIASSEESCSDYYGGSETLRDLTFRPNYWIKSHL